MKEQLHDRLQKSAVPMSIGSVSFYQQDRNYWNQNSFYSQDTNYWNQQVAQSDASTADDSLISAMGSAVTNEASGLAQIANQEALARVNNQIASDEKALEAASGTSTSSSSSTATGPAPATALGTIALTTSTPLASLRIPPGGVITVSDGTNTTTYTSTGTDSIADLIGAINTNVAGNAYVNASLNGHGNLVITGKDQTENITVGGTFASDVGFGPGHQTFQPTAGSSSSSSSSTAASSSAKSSSTGSSSSASSSTFKSASKSTTAVPSIASENASDAASFLSASGASGSLVDMLV